MSSHGIARRAEVFKVQTSVATSAPRPRVLIYNRDRSVMVELDAAPALLRLMEGREVPRAFFMGELRDGVVHLGDEVEAPGW